MLTNRIATITVTDRGRLEKPMRNDSITAKLEAWYLVKRRGVHSRELLGGRIIIPALSCYGNNSRPLDRRRRWIQFGSVSTAILTRLSVAKWPGEAAAVECFLFRVAKREILQTYLKYLSRSSANRAFEKLRRPLEMDRTWDLAPRPRDHTYRATSRCQTYLSV